MKTCVLHSSLLFGRAEPEQINWLCWEIVPSCKLGQKAYRKKLPNEKIACRYLETLCSGVFIHSPGKLLQITSQKRSLNSDKFRRIWRAIDCKLGHLIRKINVECCCTWVITSIWANTKLPSNFAQPLNWPCPLRLEAAGVVLQIGLPDRALALLPLPLQLDQLLLRQHAPAAELAVEDLARREKFDGSCVRKMRDIHVGRGISINTLIILVITIDLLLLFFKTFDGHFPELMLRTNTGIFFCTHTKIVVALEKHFSLHVFWLLNKRCILQCSTTDTAGAIELSACSSNFSFLFSPGPWPSRAPCRRRGNAAWPWPPPTASQKVACDIFYRKKYDK